MDSDPAIVALISGLGASLGLSRPAGQCFAAIWRAAQAPCADDLVAGLGLSRSNVSTALKELRAWGLVAVARAPGDRKEYFVAPADPWVLAGRLIGERQRREVAPALDRLLALEGDGARRADLAGTLAEISAWMAALARLPPAELAAYMRALPEPGRAEAARKKKKKKK